MQINKTIPQYSSKLTVSLFFISLAWLVPVGCENTPAEKLPSSAYHSPLDTTTKADTPDVSLLNDPEFDTLAEKQLLTNIVTFVPSEEKENMESDKNAYQSERPLLRKRKRLNNVKKLHKPEDFTIKAAPLE